MKLFNQILSIALLLLFVANSLHDVLPHIHHEHGSISSFELDKNDYYNHKEDLHHHNSNESGQEHQEYSFFDFLFANHSHTKHVHQDIPKIVEHSKRVKHFDNKELYNTTFVRPNFPPLKKELHRLLLTNLSVPDNPYLQSNLLRGPPSLG